MDSLASILQKTGFCITRKHLNLIGIPASYQQKLAVRCNREITRMNARQLIATLVSVPSEGETLKIATPSACRRLEAYRNFPSGDR